MLMFAHSAASFVRRYLALRVTCELGVIDVMLVSSVRPRDVIMGSIANVGGGGGRAIAEGRYRDMCGEGVCGDCVDIGMDAAAVEGGASVAIECATR